MYKQTVPTCSPPIYGGLDSAQASLDDQKVMLSNTTADAGFAQVGYEQGLDGERFRARLRWACDRVGGVVALSDRCDVQAATIRKWLRGSSEPNRRRLIEIARGAEIAEDWLATGEGWHFPYQRGHKTEQGSDAFRVRLVSLVNQEKSLIALSRLIGVGESNLRRWMEGPAEPPRMTLIKLAHAKSIPLKWLLTGKVSTTRLDCRVCDGPFDRSHPLAASDPGYATKEVEHLRTHPVTECRYPPHRRASATEYEPTAHEPETSTDDRHLRMLRGLLMQEIAGKAGARLSPAEMAEIFDVCLGIFTQLGTDRPTLYRKAESYVGPLANIMGSMIAGRSA